MTASEQVDLALEAKNIGKSYGSLKALDEVSLQVKKGECFALLGPNGAGKTTLCEVLEGLIPADTGEIQILGKNFAQDKKEILEDIGVQLQETRLYGKYTVLETLCLFASFYKKKENFDKLIDLLGLESLQDSYLEKLSTGQRQRVYIACALVHQPKVLFLDEPTASLDPQSKLAIWQLIKNLKLEGRSIFLTTHDMDEAHKLASRVAIIDQGKIIACDTAENLIKKNLSEDTLELELGDYELQELSKKLPWLLKIKKNGPSSYLFRSQNTQEELSHLLSLSHSLKLPVQSFSLRAKTLEEVFLKLTGRSMRHA